MNKWFLAVAATIALCASAQAQTDTYPSKPVRIIVDSAPGSATDVASRVFAERLSRIWNQQVLTLNHPGAGGSIAARVASQSAADGYTLYVGAASVFTALKGAPGVAPNLPVQLPGDFAPIGFMTQQPMFMAVAPSLGINSLAQLIVLAKSKPGELSYGTTGRGRITHLTMELLQSRTGIKMQMIPYTGGPHASLSDLITGRIAVVVEGYSGLAGAMQSGTIKGLAVASHQRLQGFENLPTVAETVPGFIAGGWNVMLTPVGTPASIINKINADMRTTTDDPEVKQKLAALGAFVRPMSPSEVTAFSQEQQELWRPIAEQIAKEAVRETK
jgi:tripartite-type tricarboxylate transporter receptor subunit TctC